MKVKISLFLVLCFIFSLFAMAQNEVSISVGRLLTSSNGNALKYSTTFETNTSVAFRHYFTDKIAISSSVTTDTVKVEKFLLKHNFIDTYSNNYQYTKVAINTEYHFKHLYLTAGIPIFFSPNKNINTKAGIEFGVGAKYMLTKHFGINTQATYCYLKDFIVPIANVVFANVSVIYRF